MPKETNKVLNPYYFELLKFLVVYKFRSRISNEISTDEREELAIALNAYNTPDSLNRIFSKGQKRRQNFNTTSLAGLCKYLGHEDWDAFIKKEYVNWAEELDGLLYINLESKVKQQLHSFIILRILKQVESNILKGLQLYIEELGKQINNGNTVDETVLYKAWDHVVRCIDIASREKRVGWLDVLYTIAENIEYGKAIFEDLGLPQILKNELFELLKEHANLSEIDQLVAHLPDSLEKDILVFYRKKYKDEEIKQYYELKGINLSIEQIKQMRWQTAEVIFKKLNSK